ncbi:MAG: WecB/TagA/CpsF family glycosyltransferase [Luteitalea sp.]|nr:WecB/TagA/CpsF family glycosyltransferase [Luteitalea sp.]
MVDDGSDALPPPGVTGGPRPFRLRLIRQAALGVSAARNNGFQVSDSDIVLFVDSDVELLPTFINELLAAINRHPGDVAFQARLVGDPVTWVGRMEDLRVAAVQRAQLAPDGRIRYLNTSAFAIRRTSASEALFDPGAVRGQDSLLLARLIKTGHRPVYAAAAVAMHRPRLSLCRYLLKHFAIGHHTKYARYALRDAGSVLMCPRKRISLMMSLIAQPNSPRLYHTLTVCLILLAYAIELCGRVTASLFGMDRGRHELMSVTVDGVGESELVARIVGSCGRRPLIVSYLHGVSLVQASRNERMATTLRRCDLCFADGIGVVLALWILSLKRVRKVTANDFIWTLCRQASYQGLRVALIGATEQTNRVATSRLRQSVPGLSIVLSSHGYLSPDEEAALHGRLKSAAPDLIILGLGQPKQELLAFEIRRVISYATILCVGGLFDLIAGHRPNPPLFLRRCGFEWLYLFVMQPDRRARYAKGLPLLAYDILKSHAKRLQVATSVND